MARLRPPFYLVLVSIEGNVLTPLTGDAPRSSSPWLFSVWLLFGGWLWGVPGAIVAVSLLMPIERMCEKSRMLAPIAARLSRGTLPSA